MRWTCQTVAVFGLLAFFTFQVERSSASVLRFPVDSSPVAEPSIEEITHEAGDLEDFPQGGGFDDDTMLTPFGKTDIRSVIDRIDDLNDIIRKNLSNLDELDQQGLERVRESLSLVYQEATDILERYGSSSLAHLVRGLHSAAEDALKTVEDKINGSKDKNTGNGKVPPKPQEEFEDDSVFMPFGRIAETHTSERIDELHRFIRRELANIDKLDEQGLERLRKNLSRVYLEAKGIAEGWGNSRIGSAAKGIFAAAKSALKKVEDKINGSKDKTTGKDKVTPKPQEGGFDDDTVLMPFRGIAETETRGDIDELRRFIRRELANIDKLDEQGLERLRKSFARVYLYAKGIAEGWGNSRIGGAAKDIFDEAKSALKEVEDKIKAYKDKNKDKVTPKPQEEGFDDDAVFMPFRGIAETETRGDIDELRRFIRRELANIDKLDEQGLERLRKSFARVYLYAKGIAEGWGNSRIGGAAKDIFDEAKSALKEVEDKIKAYKDKNKGKVTPKPQEEEFEDDSVFMPFGRIAETHTSERIDELRRFIRRELANIDKLDEQGLERLRKNLSLVYREAQGIAQGWKKSKIGGAAKDIFDVAKSALKTVEDKIKAAKDKTTGKDKVTPKPQEEGFDDDAVLMPFRGIAETETRGDIDELRRFIRRELANIDKLDEQGLERLRKSFARVYLYAKGIAEGWGNSRIGGAAKDIFDEAKSALKEVEDKIKAYKDKNKGKVTPKPDPITEEKNF